MKHTTHHDKTSRRTRPWAVALLAACFGAASLSAQTSSSGTTSGQTGTGTSSGQSGTGTTSGQSGTSGRDRTSGSGSSSYGTGQTGATGSVGSGGASRGDMGNLKRSDRRFIEKAAENGHKEMALSQLAAQRSSNQEVRSFAQQLVTEHQQVNRELAQLAQSKGVTIDSAMGMMRSGSDSSSGSMSGTTTSGGRTTSGGTTGTSTGTTSPSMGGTSTATSTGATSDSTSGTMAGSTDRSRGSAAGLADAMADRHYRSLAKETGRDFDEEYLDMMIDAHEDAVKLFEKASKDAQDSEVRSFASKHVSALREHLEKAKNLTRAVAE